MAKCVLLLLALAFADGNQPSAASTVAAGPIEKPRKLTPDERQRYATALAAGRQAADKDDPAAALAGFRAALAIQPDDPAALSELGWVAFQQKDLDQAERITRRAVRLASGWYVKRGFYCQSAGELEQSELVGADPFGAAASRCVAIHEEVHASD